MGVPANGGDPKGFARWLVLCGLPVLLALAVPFLVICAIAWVFAAAAVHLAAWARGLGRPWVVVVYSDSPKWKEHIEKHLLPSLPASVTVLNLSRKRQWSRLSLGRCAFQVFAGTREYCPIALVFLPGKPVRRFRFYRPFVDAKHGRQERLRQLEEELSRCVDGVL